MDHNEKIASRPRLLKELANYYHVSAKTMRKWLMCESMKHIVPECGNYYSINQVKIIVGHFGEEDNI